MRGVVGDGRWRRDYQIVFKPLPKRNLDQAGVNKNYTCKNFQFSIALEVNYDRLNLRLLESVIQY